MPRPVTPWSAHVLSFLDDPDDQDGLAAEVIRDQRRRLRRLDRVPSLLLGLALGSTLLLYGGQHLLARYPIGQTSARSPRVYRPPHPLDRARLARLPVEQALAELLPDLTLKAAHLGAGRTTPAAVERAGERLASALAPDPNLAGLVADLRAGLAAPAGSRTRLALLDTAAALAGYLDAGGLPFHLEAGFLQARKRPPSFYVTSYRTVRELAVAAGDARFRARLLRRLDRTSVTELYLGHATDARTGALVVLDRISDYARQELLPRLASGEENRSPLVAAAFGEIEAALGGPAMGQLRALARREPGPGSFRALETLATFLARITLVHEVRHLADQRQQRGLERPLRCPGCPSGLGTRRRAELSAYLASLATPGQSATALLQVCDTLSHSPQLGGVLELIGRHVARCEGPFPADAAGLSATLTRRARAAEQHLFGRSEPIELPLPLLPGS